MSTHTSQRGFTLVELMVVIVIVGILAAVALPSIEPGRYSDTVLGFTEEVVAELDATRWRATSANKWQLVTVNQNRIDIYQATAEGMDGIPLDDTTNCEDPWNGTSDPTAIDETNTQNCWLIIKSMLTPRDLDIVMASPRAHVNTNDSLPAAGDNIPAYILIAPDGSARDNGWTLFLSNKSRTEAARAVVYRASGTVSVFRGW